MDFIWENTHDDGLSNIQISLSIFSFSCLLYSPSYQSCAIKKTMEVKSDKVNLKNIDMSKQTPSLFRYFPISFLGKAENLRKVDLSKFSSIFNPIPFVPKSHESNLIIITHHKAIFTFLMGKNDFHGFNFPKKSSFLCYWNKDNKITFHIHFSFPQRFALNIFLLCGERRANKGGTQFNFIKISSYTFHFFMTLLSPCFAPAPQYSLLIWNEEQ